MASYDQEVQILLMLNDRLDPFAYDLGKTYFCFVYIQCTKEKVN